jgi:hypothetical protein
MSRALDHYVILDMANGIDRPFINVSRKLPSRIVGILRDNEN